jgi:hypothetical protein
MEGEAPGRGRGDRDDLVVTFGDGSKERLQFPVEERWHRYIFEKPVRVESAQLDPEGKILLDLDKLDDGATRETHPKTALRWALEAANFVELALSLLVTQ